MELIVPAQIEEFRNLRRRTSLGSIIKASRSITDRIDFLAALRILVFHPDVKKNVLERSQLHRILESETWVFGEEFNLTASDRGLTEVLAQHVKLLGRTELVPTGEALDVDGRRRIVDLMLSRVVPLGRRKHEHLVVELKAPKVVIREKELTQIKNYALAVAKNSQFNRLEVQWDFVIISTDLDPYARAEATQRNREPGLVWDQDGIRVWARTWSEVIDEADHRLKFVKDKLGYSPSDELALDYLRKTHGAYVPESLRATDEAVAPVPSADQESAGTT